MNMKTLAALALLASSGVAQFAFCEDAAKTTTEEEVKPEEHKEEAK